MPHPRHTLPLLAALLLGGCGDDDTSPTGNPGGDDGPGPTATVTFRIDDRANQTYQSSDGLAWKGSFSYDASSRLLTYDPGWGGPYVLLYDDGPLDAGGHEPADAVAGDHVWSVSVLVDNTYETTFEYGAIRGSVDGADGEWIWIGSNGLVTVPADSEGPIAATEMVIPLHGTIDLRLTVDVSGNGANLAAKFQGTDYSGLVTVKGSVWGWRSESAADDGTDGDEVAGDGIHTFLLSARTGPHEGLLNAGDAPRFMVELDGVEYRVSGAAATDGLGAAFDARGGFEPTPILVDAAGSQQNYVEVP